MDQKSLSKTLAAADSKGLPHALRQSGGGPDRGNEGILSRSTWAWWRGAPSYDHFGHGMESRPWIVGVCRVRPGVQVFTGIKTVEDTRGVSTIDSQRDLIGNR